MIVVGTPDRRFETPAVLVALGAVYEAAILARV